MTNITKAITQDIPEIKTREDLEALLSDGNVLSIEFNNYNIEFEDDGMGNGWFNIIPLSSDEESQYELYLEDVLDFFFPEN